MASDELYKLASEFYKLKLWEKLSSDQIFGVKLSDGRIAYCSAQDFDEYERTALAVFVGRENFDSHRYSEMNFYEISENEDFLLQVSQNCLQCIFDAKLDMSDEEIAEEKSFSKRNKIYFRARFSHPRFLKFRPLSLSTVIEDAEEEKILVQTLKAAIEVGKKFPGKLPRKIEFLDQPPFRRKFPLLEADGESFKWSMERFPPFRYVKYPEANLNYKDAKKLFDAKKIRNYCCEIFILPSPIEDEEGELKFSVLFLAYDKKRKFLLSIEPAFDYLTTSKKFTENISKTFLKVGVPKKIFVRSERTFIFLEKFCEQTGIELCEVDEMPEMDFEQEKLLKLTDVQDGGDEFFSRIFDLVESESVAELKKILPPDFKGLLQDMLDKNMFAPHLVKKVSDVLNED